MKKVYQKPEFEVIRQNQANAKFFVASFESSPAPTSAPSGAPDGTTNSRASSYGTVTGGTDGTDENGGFTF